MMADLLNFAPPPSDLNQVPSPTVPQPIQVQKENQPVNGTAKPAPANDPFAMFDNKGPAGENADDGFGNLRANDQDDFGFGNLRADDNFGGSAPAPAITAPPAQKPAADPFDVFASSAPAQPVSAPNAFASPAAQPFAQPGPFAQQARRSSDPFGAPAPMLPSVQAPAPSFPAATAHGSDPFGQPTQDPFAQQRARGSSAPPAVGHGQDPFGPSVTVSAPAQANPWAAPATQPAQRPPGPANPWATAPAKADPFSNPPPAQRQAPMATMGGKPAPDPFSSIGNPFDGFK